MPAPIAPVSDEELTRLHELTAAERSLADQIYGLEMEKIPILAAGRRVREEQVALYKRIAAERGIPETTIMSINPRTGEIVLGGAPETPEVESPPAPAPTPPG